MRSLILAAGLVALASVAHAQSPATNLNPTTNGSGSPAAPNGHIAWPVGAPVWEFDFYRPANRTTSQGTGLEIRNLTYMGRRVFERASVPVLNVEYDAGGCGCYRDWQYTESRYVAPAAAGGTAASGYVDAVAGQVTTNCERTTSQPNGQIYGTDLGSFNGVSVEDYGTELILTGHTNAGWYRYRVKWHFYTDGRIWPEYSFASTQNSCTQRSRRHHAYWRFDFDLEDTPSNDIVTERSSAGVVTTFDTEARRTWASDPGTTWAVTDGTTGAGFTIEPSTADRRLPVDAFSKADVLVLRYKAGEIDDGISIGSGCAFQFEPWLNSETVNNADNVLWYRSSSARTTGTCELVGPTLRAFGYRPVAGEGAPAAALPAVEVQAAVPNPFTPQTSVRFRVAASQDVRVVLYDALGRAVRTLFEGPVEAGVYETVEIAGGSLPAGTYVVRVEGSAAAGSTRIVLAR